MIFAAQFGVLPCCYKILQYPPLCSHRVVAPVLDTPKAVSGKPGNYGGKQFHSVAKIKNKAE